MAVPIDISTIDAHLTFDAAAQAAHGAASLAFVVGPTAGRPVFDLRQTITEVVLDGAALPVTAVPLVDLGGGPGAEVRVLDAVLASGTGHTLAVGYDVGLPASPPGGGYPPHLVWSGPAGAGRLQWNVGFTDLAPARYLESWVPANLIWDQCTVTWEITITGTTVAHTLITNGALTTLGPNHWSVAFPGRSTALSTLIEVRPADELFSQTTAVALPAAGRTITVEAWTTTSSGIDLAAALTDLSGWLVEDDSQIGPYLHGDRFVTFLLQGGMEYDGGCTATRGTLRHEAFHSWWGRGVKPAGQPDGWIDEAWNTYHDNGAAAVDPFDFAEPAQTLCNRKPYSRITPGASYDGGARVFAGIAAVSSPPALTALMSGFYRAHADQLITTLTLEEHLAAGIGPGAPDVVDGFHHFVYGFADPSPSPDLWLRDDPGHTGSERWTGRFWDSPDLWIRHADDGGTVHQAPIAGQDNWFYARIRNRGAGAARHFMVVFNVRQYAGVEFVWPSDYLPAIAAAGGFDLGPGQDVVVRARWPAALVPPAGTHACWLAAVLSRADRPGGQRARLGARQPGTEEPDHPPRAARPDHHPRVRLPGRPGPPLGGPRPRAGPALALQPPAEGTGATVAEPGHGRIDATGITGARDTPGARTTCAGAGTAGAGYAGGGLRYHGPCRRHTWYVWDHRPGGPRWERRGRRRDRRPAHR